MEVVKEAAIDLLSDITNMNVGLMQYDTNAEGGMVLAPALPIDEGTNRAHLIEIVNGLNHAGPTPLSETLTEAYRYFAGAEVNYGDSSQACSVSIVDNNCPSRDKYDLNSVASSRTADGTKYDSPADA